MDVPSAPGAAAVCLAALGVVAALPRAFFRPGRRNARWWLTALPFLLAGAALLGGVAGALSPSLEASSVPGVVLGWVAVPSAVAGVALIGWAAGSHARPVSLWHQADDRPERLTTGGAYARIRHPFYAGFLLVLLACALSFPHPATAAALVGARVQLGRTAAREEARLTAAFGDEYRAYLARTGRFWPRRR